MNYAQAAKNALVAQVGGNSPSPAPAAATTKRKSAATTTAADNTPAVSVDVAGPTEASVSANVGPVTVAAGAPANAPTTLRTVTHTTTSHRHGVAAAQNKGVVSE